MGKFLEISNGFIVEKQGKIEEDEKIMHKNDV